MLDLVMWLSIIEKKFTLQQEKIVSQEKKLNKLWEEVLYLNIYYNQL